MNKVQTNNTNLQTILDTVNALPDAGSGGGGISTINFTAVGTMSNRLIEFWYTKNHELIHESMTGGNDAAGNFNNYIFEADKNTIVYVTNLRVETSGVSYYKINGGAFLIKDAVTFMFTVESDNVIISAN